MLKVKTHIRHSYHCNSGFHLHMHHRRCSRCPCRSSSHPGSKRYPLLHHQDEITPVESDSLTGVALSTLSPEVTAFTRSCPEEAALMTENCEENSKAPIGRKRNNMILDCGEEVSAERSHFIGMPGLQTS